MKELAAQVLFFNHIQKNHQKLWDSKLIFSVPNGGQRNAREGCRLKASGVVKGVSDILVLIPRGEYHGLCLEMKIAGGRLSPEQSIFLENAKKRGYKTVVAIGHEEAIKAFEDYISDISCSNCHYNVSGYCDFAKTVPKWGHHCYGWKDVL